jgi:uroporphyrinogen-III synthase
MKTDEQGGASAGPLAGQRILITRPAGRADDLIAAIAAAGGSAVHVPLLVVEPLDAGRDAQQWQCAAQNLRQLASYRRVIAISVNAVHYGMQWLERLQGSAAIASPGIDWYGIGAATATEFARWGIEARGGGFGATSEALLALPELQQVRGESILILRGVGGRETLAGILRERGASVAYAECYRRVAPRLDDSQRQLLQQAGFAAVCVNSAETLRNFFDAANSSVLRTDAAAPSAVLRTEVAALSKDWRTVALVVPSARVAQLAEELGFERVIVAANAGTEATLTALCVLTRGVASGSDIG